ncbi:hypothetical protein NKG05_15945 [Oerskovia sp. M15]
MTHDHDEAFTVADRVAVMDAGRLLQVAAPEVLWRERHRDGSRSSWATRRSSRCPRLVPPRSCQNVRGYGARWF